MKCSHYSNLWLTKCHIRKNASKGHWLFFIEKYIRTNSACSRHLINFYHLFSILYIAAGQKIKKSPGKKNSWNQINQLFFSWNCIFGSFKLFYQFKNWFLVIFEFAENGIRSKTFLQCNWFIWFHRFFFNFLAHCVPLV